MTDKVKSAELILKLYDLRREEVMREARNWFFAFTPESVEPRIGAGVRLGELVRIVGDVELGERSRVGQRTAIRADEGTPIIIGLQNQNEVAIFQGASATGALAFLADALLIGLSRPRSRPPHADPGAQPAQPVA